MTLLREVETTGAPDDYLLARIRFRRRQLEVGAREYCVGQGGPRQIVKSEYVWVYTRLSRRLRRTLLPFFEYFELRTLVVALRYLSAGDRPAVVSQLRSSLLHPQLIQSIAGAELAAPAVVALESALARDYPYFNGLAETYLRQGPGGLEQALLGGCLQTGISSSRSQILREFLAYLVDMRNLLAIYKHLRWQVPSPPPLLPGGELPAAACEKIWADRDQSRLLTCIQKRSRLPGDPAGFGVEDFLLLGLTDLLRHAGRDPLQPGVILDYLWQCLQGARSCSKKSSIAENGEVAV